MLESLEFLFRMLRLLDAAEAILGFIVVVALGASAVWLLRIWWRRP